MYQPAMCQQSGKVLSLVSSPNKLTSIQALTQSNQETSKVSWYQASIDGRNIYLIDTPGFSDDKLSDVQILEHISKELLENYQNGRLLSGIIYLYDISQRRIRGDGIQV